MISATEKQCEDCEYGEPIQPRIIDGMDGWPEIYVEGKDLIFINGNDECVFNASYCPMCGRELGGDAR